MRFIEQYAFLSNFYISPIRYGGIVWKSVEHAYQAAKTEIVSEKQQIASAETPAMAKSLGRTITISNDWNDKKVSIMKELLDIKFSNPELESLLKLTDGIPIVEENYWGDTFWGVDIRTGKGTNILGKLLMQIREEKFSFV